MYSNKVHVYSCKMQISGVIIWPYNMLLKVFCRVLLCWPYRHFGAFLTVPENYGARLVFLSRMYTVYSCTSAALSLTQSLAPVNHFSCTRLLTRPLSISQSTFLDIICTAVNAMHGFTVDFSPLNNWTVQIIKSSAHYLSSRVPCLSRVIL